MHPIIHETARRVFCILPERLNGFLVRSAKDFIPAAVRSELGMLDMNWSLRNLAANGWSPSGILDVGACRGFWASMARKVFPNTELLMIEANPDCRNDLAVISGRLQPCSFEMALLGHRPVEAVPFYHMGEGSSVLPELTDIPCRRLSLPMRRLDDILAEHGTSPPFLLKLDVQGYELEVLKGGAHALEQSEAVFMETSVIPYNANAPLHAEVVAYMKAAGFVAYDICGTRRRASDGALFQIDLLFVKEASSLRSAKRFY